MWRAVSGAHGMGMTTTTRTFWAATLKALGWMIVAILGLVTLGAFLASPAPQSVTCSEHGPTVTCQVTR